MKTLYDPQAPIFFQCIFAVLALLKPCHTTDFAMEVIIKALPKNV